MAQKAKKRTSLREEVAENVYEKCKHVRGENDPMCQGLYAQHKTDMIDTNEFIDRVDDYTKRAKVKRKRKKEEPSIYDEEA
jgi:hypothetical protein